MLHKKRTIVLVRGQDIGPLWGRMMIEPMLSIDLTFWWNHMRFPRLMQMTWYHYYSCLFLEELHTCNGICKRAQMVWKPFAIGPKGEHQVHLDPRLKDPSTYTWFTSRLGTSTTRPTEYPRWRDRDVSYREILSSKEEPVWLSQALFERGKFKCLATPRDRKRLK